MDNSEENDLDDLIGDSNKENETEMVNLSVDTENRIDVAEFESGLSPTNRILFDGSFFKINFSKTKNSTELVAKCVKCLHENEVKGSTKSTSNFRSHLKRAHGEVTLQELNHYIQEKKMYREIPPQNSNTKKIISKSVKSKFSQELFESDIIDFITGTFAPINTVENRNFRKIFDHMEIPSLKHISRKKLTNYIEVTFEENKRNIKKNLGNIDFVCTTTDVWSSKHRRFLGVTCHWIDSETLERKSAALACKRFPGTHSFDRIADQLIQCHHDYDLRLSQITGTVTDNGSNFVKAFAEYGIPINNENDYITTDETPPFEESGFLPPHIRCCSHTLSLIATNDILNTIKMDGTLNTVHEHSLKKCTSLWLLTSHPKTSEIIKDTIGISLNRPVITRWNSFYDAITAILKICEKLPLLTTKLKLQPFTNNDIKYLTEYVRCLAPLAIALDRLQGEEAVFLGYVLPSLLEIKKKCEKLLVSQKVTYCKPILSTIISKLDSRFDQYLALDCRSHSAIIASFSLPVFKTRWLAAVEENDRERLRSIFFKAVRDELQAIQVLDGNNDQSQNEDFYFGDDSFTDFVPLRPSVELEALKYFGDCRKNLQMLKDYPVTKLLFLKYNTTLPSSAPVERLFSYATMFNIAKFGCLSDEHFEERVL